jgi:flagellum-specific peptidoglycan hydrolase FlgJ
MKMFILTSVACILAYFLTKTVVTFKVLLTEPVVETVMDEEEEEQEEEEEDEEEEQEEGEEEEEQEEEEQEEEEQEEEGEQEEKQKDQDNMLVEDIDDDMPSLETGMPHLEDIIEMTPFTVTLNAETSERTLDLSGNIPWSFLPFTLENNDVNPELMTREMLVDTQINELKTELKSFATHEAVDLLCQQMHELSQKNNLNDVSAIVTEMRSQLETFATKESLSSLTQEVSSLKSHVAQMITDMTALMDKMNLVDSLTIEKDVRQAWFGKMSGPADPSGAGTGPMVDIDLTVRITYDKAHSVSDNKSWLASVKKDDRESHRDGLVGYTDTAGWHIDPVKKTAIKRYHKNEWSGDATDIHVSIDFSRDTAWQKGFLTGSISRNHFANIFTYLYEKKLIIWERQLLNI